MRIKASLVLLFVLMVVQANAQTNFLKGYYVTTSQDTVRGYIEYLSEDHNYQVCHFAKDAETKPIKLYPKSIIGYVVDDKDVYERHTYKSRKGEELEGFFRVMVRGRLSLLRFRSRYYAGTPDGQVVEISRRSDIKDGKAREDYYGLGMLKVLMKDCDKMTAEVLESEYKSTSSYFGIFYKYNRCVSSKTWEPTKISIKPHLSVGIVGGGVVSQMGIDGALSAAKFDQSMGAAGGIFGSVLLPRVNSQSRFVFEATYSKSSQYSYFSENNVNNDLFMDFTALRIPLFMRYSFGKLFVDAGMQNQFLLSQNYRWRTETVSPGVVVTAEKPVTTMDRWGGGLLSAVGIKFNVAGFPLRTSLRYSHIFSSQGKSTVNFSVIEMNLSVQLTK